MIIRAKSWLQKTALLEDKCGHIKMETNTCCNPLPSEC